MSTPAHKANLARIRDNQRRSRARRREYLTELEQRIRQNELQGIEASTEVQLAARKVAEENRSLRELLHKQGVSDDFITHYLQNTAQTPADLAHPSAPAVPFGPSAGGNAGSAAQSLQHTLTPRRPTSLEHSSITFPLGNQSSREASIASVSTGNSSMWETQQQGLPSNYAHHPAMNVVHTMQAPPTTPHYTTSVYPGEATPRIDPFHGQHHAALIESQRQQVYHQPVIHHASQSVPLHYSDPNVTYHANPRDYVPPGGYC